jgi:hypothetical protein
MASGFIVLPDGRCFSRRWSAHDVVLRAVANELSSHAFRHWLLEHLSGPSDEEELGYGAWLRSSDQSIILRVIDLRLVTRENQQEFCDAAKRAAVVEREEAWLAKSLSELADMVMRMERGEPPLSKSDWVDVLRPEGGHIGPGWPAT